MNETDAEKTFRHLRRSTYDKVTQAMEALPNKDRVSIDKCFDEHGWTREEHMAHAIEKYKRLKGLK